MFKSLTRITNSFHRVIHYTENSKGCFIFRVALVILLFFAVGIVPMIIAKEFNAGFSIVILLTALLYIIAFSGMCSCFEPREWDIPPGAIVRWLEKVWDTYCDIVVYTENSRRWYIIKVIFSLLTIIAAFVLFLFGVSQKGLGFVGLHFYLAANLIVIGIVGLLSCFEVKPRELP